MIEKRKRKKIPFSIVRLHFHYYHKKNDQAVSVGGDVMPSMAYLLLPFKCLVFNLYFVFFLLLCSNNRKRYGTRQYEHKHIQRHT
jgi:hypothetical protein